MAGLRNASGQVVIDKNEAQNEIRKIGQVKSKLAETKRLLDPSKLDDAHMQGETRNALSQTLSKLNKEFMNLAEDCTSVSNYINQVVTKYERIDREYARKLKESR